MTNHTYNAAALSPARRRLCGAYLVAVAGTIPVWVCAHLHGRLLTGGDVLALRAILSAWPLIICATAWRADTRQRTLYGRVSRAVPMAARIAALPIVWIACTADFGGDEAATYAEYALASLVCIGDPAVRLLRD